MKIFDIFPHVEDLISTSLQWSGVLTFGALGIWVVLKLILLISDGVRKTEPKAFPTSAQRFGFAQNIGAYSVIVSELDYKMRQEQFSWFRRLVKTWWPITAWAAVSQFLALYGAQGLALQLGVHFGWGLVISLSSLGVLGLYRKSMLKDHLRATSIVEGTVLDWDAEAFIGGIRLRARFEGRPRRVILSRLEQNVLSKDRAQVYYWHGLSVQPESVHTHGAGALVSEFRLLDHPEETLDEQNWIQKIKLRDVMGSILSSFVASNSNQMFGVALLEYPGAVIMITPLAEHVEYLESVGERLRNRKHIPTIAAREVALAASQEFYTRFDEKKVSGLLAHQRWVDREDMKI